MVEEELKLTDAIKRLPERPLWWMDPVFSPLEELSGVSKEDWTAAVGSQLIAAGVELPVQYFTTALGGKVVSGVLGLGTLGLALSRAVSGRGALETLVIGGHFLSEVLDPRPETTRELLMDLANLQEGIRESNPTRIIDSFLRIGGGEEYSREEALTPSEEGAMEEIPIGEETPITEEVPVGEEITEEVPLEEEFSPGEEGGYTPVTEESESTEEGSTEETPPATEEEVPLEEEKEGGYTPVTAETTEL